MANDLKGPLLSELYCAFSYAERVVFTVCHLGQVGSHYERQEAQEMALDFQSKLHDFLRLMVLRPAFGLMSVPQEEIKNHNENVLENLRKTLEQIQQLFIALTHFSLNNDQIIRAAVECCNIAYDGARPLHQWCIRVGKVDIAYPRLNIVDIEDHHLGSEGVLEFDQDFDHFEEHQDTGNINGTTPAPEGNDLPRFHLSLEKMQEVMAFGPNIILSLEMQRDRKFQKLLKEGHRLISQKKYPEAEVKFNEAISVKESAESLTLLAWAMALQGKDAKSKSLCLRAINKNPTYGPPYNDLGALLYKASEFEESLKWFELAKKAPHYQNREFPYINSGRVYLTQKKYHKALDEFAKAQVLVPFNKDLEKAIDKVKKQIEDSMDRDISSEAIKELSSRLSEASRKGSDQTLQ